MRIGLLRLVRPRTLLAVGLLTLALGVIALLPGARTLEAKASGPAPLRVAVIDVSASRARTEGAAGEYERYVRHALLGFAKRAAEAEERVGVVAFAESANVLFGPGEPEELVQRLEGRGGHSPLRPRASEGRECASRLDAALQVFEEALSPPGGRPGTLELYLRQGTAGRNGAFSERSFEGFFEGPDPTPRFAQLRGRGVRVIDGDALAAEEGRGGPPAPSVDVCVRSLALPERVSAGERLALRAELAFRGDHSGLPGGQVVLVRARRIGENREAEWTSLSHRFVTAGRGEVQLESLVLDLEATGAGRCEVQLEVALLDEAGRSSQDAFPENDVLRASTRVGDSITGVVVAPLAEHAMFDSLRGVEGLELILLDVEAQGARDQLAQQLGSSDFVCLSNTTLEDRDQGVPSRELVTFVENGGGLWVFTGWRTLTAWPALEAQEAGTAWSLLPLTPAIDRREARDIVFLVDGSGSMRGEPIDRVRRALFELAAGAPANDWMDLYFFTGALTKGLVLSGGEEGESSKSVRRERLRRLLDARVPGGSTQILTSLEQLATEREKVPLAQRREALVFLLSDGRELDPFRVVERSEALRQRFVQGRARLVPIAVGENPSLGFLWRLVPEGETLLRAEAFEGLEEIFQREVTAERVLLDETELLLGEAPAPSASPAAAARAVLSAPRGGRRTLGWRARVQLQEGATPLLFAKRTALSSRGSSAASDPALALVERGLGLVMQAAFPSSPQGAAATEAARGLEPEELLALFRLLGRHARDKERAPELGFVGNELHLFHVPLDWPVELRGRIVERAGGLLSEETRLGEVRFTLPGGVIGVDPRRERVARRSSADRSLSATEPGQVRFELEDPRSGEVLAVLPAPRAPVAAEFALPVPQSQRRPLDDWLTPPGEPSAPADRKSRGTPTAALVLLSLAFLSLFAWAFSLTVPTSGESELGA